MKPFPEDYEFIAFFEQEPDLLDTDTPWIYNNIIFRGSQGELEYYIELYQACGELDIKLSLNGKTIINLSLVDVIGITFHENNSEAVMMVTFREDDNAGLLKFRIKPAIAIEWAFEKT